MKGERNLLWFLGLLALPAACGAPASPAAAGANRVPTLAEKKARLPAVPQLPCFECHRFAAYETGPRFPHTSDAHQDLGHCHRCHRSGGHHGTLVDEAACQECHDEIPNRAPAPGPSPTPASDAEP